MRAARVPSEIEEGRRVRAKGRAVRAERVAGAMEEGSRRPCSRVWWVDKTRRRRGGGDEGRGEYRPARAVL